MQNDEEAAPCCKKKKKKKKKKRHVSATGPLRALLSLRALLRHYQDFQDAVQQI
jgi:hypothetical protein